MDVMRLPLGILSGIGFIGAGAILRKGEIVSGVTTAATIWLITVIGLCFGGGQIWLGVASTALAWIILYVLKRFDAGIERERRAWLTIRTTLGAAIETDMEFALSASGVRSHFVTARYDRERETRQVTYEICWRARFGAKEPREVVQTLLGLPGVQRISWQGTE
jgi:putative Mg2+ transporter-C (MgtC) family protein